MGKVKYGHGDRANMRTLNLLINYKNDIVPVKEDYVSLQISLERNSLNLSYIFLLNVNFENLTVELHNLYVLNLYVKFHSNQILFTIQSINLFFVHNFLLQNLKFK